MNAANVTQRSNMSSYCQSEKDIIRYAYLVSASYSGSTLLACLLSAHPEISTVGEFGSEFSKRVMKCSCGLAYMDCPFWLEWQARARKAGIDFDLEHTQLNVAPQPNSGFLDSLFYRLFANTTMNRLRDFSFSAASRRWRRAFATVDHSVKLARILCRMQETQLFFDSTKNPFQLRFLARHPGVRLKVVSLVRDGRAVSCSYKKHHDVSMRTAAAEWAYSVTQQQRSIRQYVPSSDVFHLKLIELCEDPQGTLKRLFQFLEVRDQPSLDFSMPQNRHITGNTMRLTFNGEIRYDDTWKRQLGPEDLREFESVAGRLNRQLGYVDSFSRLQHCG